LKELVDMTDKSVFYLINKRIYSIKCKIYFLSIYLAKVVFPILFSIEKLERIGYVE
jgi:hypothetical protein